MPGYGDNLGPAKRSGMSPQKREALILEHTPLIRFVAGRIAMRLPSRWTTGGRGGGLSDAVDSSSPEEGSQYLRRFRSRSP